jgi:ADP-ribose pyrophosphatase YjhB (NUDIX family)
MRVGTRGKKDSRKESFFRFHLKLPHMLRSPIKHCKNCGAAVAYRVPDDGDTKERAVCPACHTIHYENPLNVVGTVPHFGERVLLCKRNIEPRWGKWTLPAGFMELGETTAEGAARETDEEAGAQFEMEELFSVMNVPRVGQVHLFYRAKLLSDQFNPGVETIEAKLFTEDEIPWDEIAFRTVKETLEHYFADRRAGRYGFHNIDIQ